MTLLSAFLEIVQDWRPIFPQQRSFQRALRQALGSLLCLGRRTLSRIIWANGGEQKSWSAEYLLHSRCVWEPQRLFEPILQRALAYCPGRYVGVAVDETRLRKTGRCIQQAFYQRDPLSPPFHCNLILGLRFLQASLLVPLYRRTSVGCRALPLRFQEVSAVKRPRRRAPKVEWQNYRAAVKKHNLSQHFVSLAREVRAAFDAFGGAGKIVVLAADGSFCNRTVFTQPVPRVQLIVRARKNARLCFAAPATSRRFYSPNKFTPEQVRQDAHRDWQTAKVFYGGQRRKIRYKEVRSVLWQGGARRRLLRLLVVAPTPYRKRKSGRLYYRQPAYLLTTVLRDHTRQLLQIYFDRWQIEVNHREEKDTLGVGQAQLWNPTSVPKQPVLVVAAYSALLLASLQAFGAERGQAYAPLPKWRRSARRPSCLDLVTLLRKEMSERPELVAPFGLNPSYENLASGAAA
jgi:DDE superfamily endonuclease